MSARDCATLYERQGHSLLLLHVGPRLTDIPEALIVHGKGRCRVVKIVNIPFPAIQCYQPSNTMYLLRTLLFVISLQLCKHWSPVTISVSSTVIVYKGSFRCQLQVYCYLCRGARIFAQRAELSADPRSKDTPFTLG